MLIFLYGREFIVKLLAPGFDEKTFELALQMTSIILLLLPIKAMFNVLAAYLNSIESFLILSFCNFIIINIFDILGIYLSSANKTLIIPIFYVLGELFALIILWIHSYNVGFRFRPHVNLRDTNMNELFRLSLPMGLSLMTNQINSVIDRALASNLSKGSMSALNYANRVQSIIMGLTITIIATVTFPKLNKLFAKDDINVALDIIRKGLNLTAFLLIPASMGLIIFSQEIIQLLFERGSFDLYSRVLTSQALIAYSIGLLFYGYGEILIQALAAIKLQKMIFINSIITVSSNIILNLILVNIYGYVGLALATSIAGIISFFYLKFALKKYIFKDNLIDKYEVLKIVIAASVTIILLSFINYYISTKLSNYIVISILMLLGLLIYIILAYIFKIKIFKWVFQIGCKI
jgi:putative peptidoglycan lipid II flippase